MWTRACDKRVRSLTFITRVITGSVVMWVLRHSIVDGFFLRHRLGWLSWRLNQLWVGYTVSSEVEHFFLCSKCEKQTCVSQFNRILSDFSGSWFMDGWYCFLRFQGLGDRSIAIFRNPDIEKSIARTDQQRGIWTSIAQSHQRQHLIEDTQ